MGPPLNTGPGGGNEEPHKAGEVWASMLFDGYVSLLKQSQESSPRYSFDDARRRMADYVVGGRQLAPADPTYTEQRDALLAAASAADAQDAALLAQAFARRGAGTCAVSPARGSMDFSGVVEDFTVPPLLHLDSVQVDESASSCDHDGVLDVGEAGKLHLVFSNRRWRRLQRRRDGEQPKRWRALPVWRPVVSLGSIGGQATVAVDVALDSASASPAVVPFHLELGTSAACDGGTGSDVETRLNDDVTLASSATDTVEAGPSVWTPAGTDAAAIWSQEASAADAHAWRGVNFGSPSDTSLVSPPLQVSATTPLTLAFDTAYQFETGAGTFWDGAVLEVSPDDGATWVDASTYGNNLTFTGITNIPFPSLVPQATVCATTDGGPTDAGHPDAGTSDAGVFDGESSDGGSSDGGLNTTDAGTPGPGEKPEAASGCGCQTGAGNFGPTLPLLALVGLFWLLRRSRA